MNQPETRTQTNQAWTMPPFLHKVPAATGPMNTGVPWAHIEKDFPSSAQMSSPDVQEPGAGVAGTCAEEGDPKDEGILDEDDGDIEADDEGVIDALDEGVGWFALEDDGDGVLVGVGSEVLGLWLELELELELEPESDPEPEPEEPSPRNGAWPLHL